MTPNVVSLMGRMFCGIDVSKGRTPRRTGPPGRHSPALVTVDQPNTFGALPVTIARACGHDVAYYDRNAPRARSHNAALICPARRRPGARGGMRTDLFDQNVAGFRT
ncbi:MAG: hypothetical protein GX610_19335 [Rhodococcus sp.]|nr:hypothetical protein [Rhodococcus sp. (in: high G+C Gram-positive bacteria)]